jgi:hypothetical protein
MSFAPFRGRPGQEHDRAVASRLAVATLPNSLTSLMPPSIRVRGAAEWPGTGDDLDRDAGGGQGGQLARRAGDEPGGFAAQAHDVAAVGGLAQQQVGGGGLDGDADGVAAGIVEDARVGAAVMDDAVGLLQLAVGLERQEFRVRRAR